MEAKTKQNCYQEKETEIRKIKKKKNYLQNSKSFETRNRRKKKKKLEEKKYI